MSGGRSAEPGFMTALSPSDRWSCEELVARVGGGDCGAPFFFDSPQVTAAEIIETLGQRTAG